MKRLRQSRTDGPITYVPLTSGYEAIIDTADAHLVCGVNWHAQINRRADGSIRTVYAARNGTKEEGQSFYRMHRVILGAKGDVEVDHRNGNGLDNRRSNLRIATTSQNQLNASRPTNNTSGFKGVSYHKDTGKWQANIVLNGRKKYLGLFIKIEDAAAAYAKASAELHGEFGRVA